MEEIYELIEKMIADSGYPERVDGEEIYDEICDEIEGKENGEYVFMVKKNDTTHFEYRVQVMDEEFNLSGITIISDDGEWFADFDA